MRDRSDELKPYFADIARASSSAAVPPETDGRGIAVDETVTRYVHAHARFVVMVAKRYRGLGVPFVDLIGEGNLGLMEAARRYDPTRGVRFTSYAVWWIRHAMLRAVAHGPSVVRSPATVARGLRQRDRAVRQLEQDLGRTARADELAAALGLADFDKARTGGADSSLERGEAADGRVWRPIDYLVDDRNPSVENEVLRSEMASEVRRYLGALPEAERSILTMYFGLGGSEAMTLEQIGARCQRSRERIRQLKQRALRRLRAADGAQHLRDYLESC